MPEKRKFPIRKIIKNDLHHNSNNYGGEFVKKQVKNEK